MKLILLLLSVCWFSLASWSPVFRNPIHPSTPMQWLDPCSCVPNCTNPTPSPWLEEGNRELTEENLIIWLVDLQYFADEARNYYELFRNKFVRDVFQVDYKTHQNDWSNLEYSWLPKPPKKLGEPTNRGFLEKLELDQFLKDTKRYLEILAVGLEQVVWDNRLDEAEGNVHYKKEFSEMFDSNNLLLCEISGLLNRRKLEPYPMVNRSIMDQEYRNIESEMHRYVRDWIVFRAYMNVVEYILDVSSHFYDITGAELRK